MAHAKPEASEEGLTATSALLSAGRQRPAKKPVEVLAWRFLLRLNPVMGGIAEVDSSAVPKEIEIIDIGPFGEHF